MSHGRRLRWTGIALAAAGAVLAGCGSSEEEQPAPTPEPATDAGDGGDGGDGGACPGATFVQPTDGATLGTADDADHDACANGLQHDVTVASNAPDGTSVALFQDSNKLADGTVKSGLVTFAGVTLPSSGELTLKAQIGTAAACVVSAKVTVACGDEPTCNLTKPVLAASKPELNGLPVAAGGDRVSSDGSPYQTAVEVTTSVEDGQPVTLRVDGSPTLLTVQASGGKGVFPGVTLAPDGSHTLQASCTARSGSVGSSAKATVVVDTVAPDLAVASPTDGKHYDPADDVDPSTPGVQFRVCGSTAATDATDLPAVLGAARKNLCVAIGTATPSCVGVASGQGCVEVTCPGGAPFDLVATLKDDAGNPTLKKITSVSCSTSLPSVQIVSPTDGSDPAQVATHLLAASASQATRDQDGSTAGAQWTVKACTDAAGATARLLVGVADGTSLEAAGAPVGVVAATSADGCPNGYGYVATFSNVTLPESGEEASGALLAATRLRVEVTDVSNGVGSSPDVDVWVDSVAPTLQPYVPNPLCGGVLQGTTPVTTNVQLQSSASTVSLAVSSGGTPVTYTGSYMFGVATFANVAFGVGTNAISATATEASGNVASLPQDCALEVGTPPVVTWTTPVATSALCASTTAGGSCLPDADASKAGWQGQLAVHVDYQGAPLASGTVTFDWGAGQTTAALDGSGNAVAQADIPDGDSTTITASIGVAGSGTGRAKLTLPVDTIVPVAATGFTAKVRSRRATSFDLAWTAPDDGGKAVRGYDVRVAKAAITSGNFASATSMPFTGTAAQPGQNDGLAAGGLYVENDYWFGVVPFDAAGNRGPLAVVGPVRVDLNQASLVGSAGEYLGWSSDGSGDLDGDGYSDLVVGALFGSNAYVYFGGAYTKASDFGGRKTTITGPSLGFGTSVAVVGDVDGDGLEDLAIGSPSENKVYVLRGRATWPNSMSVSTELAVGRAYAIAADSNGDAKLGGASFGNGLARLGDFDGDGAPDFAVAAPYYASGAGYVAIVRGVASGTSFGSVSIPAQLGTRAFAIAGDDAQGRFGLALTGAGKLYGTTGSTLVVGALNAAGGKGRVYTFSGPLTGTLTSPLDAGLAKRHSVDGGSTADALGATVTLLGNIGGSATPDLALGVVGAPAGAGHGAATVYYGDVTNGPFVSSAATYSDSLCTGAYDGFGTAILGGGLSGTARNLSIVGDSAPDLLLAPALEANGAQATHLYILDGVKGLASGDVATSGAPVVVHAMPSGWKGTSAGSSLVPDLDLDGYADFALGEQDNNGASDATGRMIVLW